MTEADTEVPSTERFAKISLHCWTNSLSAISWWQSHAVRLENRKGSA
jgi:hypothetical protein